VKRWWAVALLLAAWPAWAAWAEELKPFVRGSMEQLVAARQGKPFLLGFWSLTCSHCQEELALLGEFSQKHPGAQVVLVATDTPEEGAAIRATLQCHGLDSSESWVFAEAFVDRLRFEVDRQWRGELPRTYFYDSAHRATAVSGKLDSARLERWARETAP
jgi:thiol-disulfide isomerase/thioredoxin